MINEFDELKSLDSSLIQDAATILELQKLQSG
jgi:hypothetical protein